MENILSSRAKFAEFVVLNNAKVEVVSKVASKNGALIKVAAIVNSKPVAFYVGYSS